MITVRSLFLSLFLSTLLLVADWSTPHDALAKGKLLCVKVPEANLRREPGTKSPLTWRVPQYMPLIQLEKKNNWIKVRDVDGDIHWVFSALVSAKIDCIAISNKIANIRKKPSTQSEKWFTVDKYAAFKKVGKKGKWVKLNYESEVMWVREDLVWPR